MDEQTQTNGAEEPHELDALHRSFEESRTRIEAHRDSIQRRVDAMTDHDLRGILTDILQGPRDEEEEKA
jgi:hypothetical protein